MANKRPHTSKTVDELISRLPGWKPPAVPLKKGEEEPEPVPVESQSVREPNLPEFSMSDKWQQRSFTKFGLMTRDAKVVEGKPVPKQWEDQKLSTRFGLITQDATENYR